mmetsp:Transcript_6957/g.14248  ORF Transcript_6957/g.14248 Transcript_6957/m.14248 type:complete len:354 (+) Transcript_6957:39-1100(+)
MSETAVAATSTTEIHDSPFEDSDRLVAAGKFLGLIEKRYVRTLNGAVHGISSILSLLLSNLLLLESLMYPKASWHSSLQLAMAVCTFLSGATLLLFWNKVQSWQLSTTSRQEKGLTIQNMRSLNQGRGVIGMMAFSIYPLVLALDQKQEATSRVFLSDVAFSQTLATSMLALSFYQASLTFAYSKVITSFYTGPRIAFSLALLQYRSLPALKEAFPAVVDFVQDEAVMIIACVQFGFLWYYLFSRRLVSKEFVQKACKVYHPTLLFVWLTRLQFSAWWRTLPSTMTWYPAYVTFATVLVMGLKQLKKMRVSKASSTVGTSQNTRRRSSIQKAVAENISMTSLRLRAMDASSSS